MKVEHVTLLFVNYVKFVIFVQNVFFSLVVYNEDLENQVLVFLQNKNINRNYLLCWSIVNDGMLIFFAVSYPFIKIIFLIQ